MTFIESLIVALVVAVIALAWEAGNPGGWDE